MRHPITYAKRPHLLLEASNVSWTICVPCAHPGVLTVRRAGGCRAAGPGWMLGVYSGGSRRLYWAAGDGIRHYARARSLTYLACRPFDGLSVRYPAVTMKRIFYLGAVMSVLFELANVYFIMPLPFSQRARSIEIAYFLYSWRWGFRAIAGAFILAGLPAAFRMAGWHRAFPVASLAVTAAAAYAANFAMAADHMFLRAAALRMQPVERNAVEPGRLVVGVEINSDARAYPVQFIGYHHQVRDVVGGTPILVTFCTVCRTGRVFSPVVDGRVETFRLVGMDHFNAMFEDKSTGSWWRQATGDAVAGPKKGQSLAELPSLQVALSQWLLLHPTSLIMQADSALRDKYSSSFDYETGASRSALTGTDTVSWHDKAWVVGVSVSGESKAYDWNRLRRERAINDELGGRSIVVALASDGASFFAFERPDSSTRFVLRGDSLVTLKDTYAFNGRGTSGTLKPVFASQEFWHSWRTFHPDTKMY
jgi:hypothetical protein